MKLLEQEFYDYKTAPVNGSDVVDLNHTGMSFYDQFIQNNTADIQYLRDKKNLKGDVVMMSPEEYYQACSEYGFPGSHPSVETLKRQRYMDKNTLNHLKNVLTVYKKKFPMPMLNKAENGQEGLHRMLVIGDMFGWDHKVPVLVVDWVDKQRAYDEAKRARITKIENKLSRAIDDTLHYSFKNIEEVEDQLQWALDKEFEYSDEIETPVKFVLTQDKDKVIVSVGEATVEFDYEDINFTDSNDNEDFDIDDIEDVLTRYFGDDWRETHPHLKDKFNIED